MGDLRVLISCRHVWSDEEAVIAQLAKRGVTADVPRFEGQQLSEADLLPIVDRYHGILAGDDELSAPVLERGTNLRVIAKWGIGVDSIDVEAAKGLGIEVLNTPGVFGGELADYAMGYIHLIARQQHKIDAMVRSGEWPKIRGASLAGKTLGIVGLGSSGRELVRRAAAASMTVLGYDVMDVAPPDNCSMRPLDDLLAESDIISLHLPSTPDSRYLVDTSSIAKMKRGVWLINTSRGALVDEVALVEGLRSGQIGAAALDVFESEPIDPANPLLEFDNVVFGSHNGSNTEEAVQRTTWRALSNLLVGLGFGEEAT